LDGATLSFACYLDDGYGEGATVVTLAGHFGLNDNWVRFEQEAQKKSYIAHGVEVLHTKDLHSTRGEFEGWQLKQKDAFSVDLFRSRAL
jgi:hypothetical protein